MSIDQTDQVPSVYQLVQVNQSIMVSGQHHANFLQTWPNHSFAANDLIVSEVGTDQQPTFNMTINEIRALIKNHKSGFGAHNLMIIALYVLLMLTSLFGNLFVCYVVLKRKRMRTSTNMLMTNLAVSDLLMTVINIPFNMVRNLLNEWPFGSVLCILVPLVQNTSVYVNTHL